MKEASDKNQLDDHDVLAAAQRFIRSRVFDVSETKRRAVVKAMSAADKWLPLLPSVIDPSNSGRDVLVVSPQEYLEASAEGATDECGVVQVVDGDLILSQREGKILARGVEENPLKIKSLAPAVVRGDVWIAGLRNVENIRLSCTGNLKINLCPSLRTLTGEVFGHAVIRGSGLNVLGADWRCQGSVNLFNCRKLETINCYVGGDFTVIGSGVRRTGVAMTVMGDTFFSGCAKLSELNGSLQGEVAICGGGVKILDRRFGNNNDLKSSLGGTGTGRSSILFSMEATCPSGVVKVAPVCKKQMSPNSTQTR